MVFSTLQVLAIVRTKFTLQCIAIYLSFSTITLNSRDWPKKIMVFNFLTPQNAPYNK